MKVFRRVLCLLTAILLCFSLPGCGKEKYPAIEPTEEEATVLFRTEDGFDVTYDLYRFLFLREKNRLSGGDETFFAEKDKAAYFRLIDDVARQEIYRVYATFGLCREQGIDPFGKEIDKAVAEALRVAIEGNEETEGYGDTETYLAAIAENDMNDNVYRLYLRHTVCEEKLAHALLEGGLLPATDEDVAAFFHSDECVHACWIYSPYSYERDKETLAAIRAEALAADDEAFARLAIRYYSGMYIDSELLSGFYLGRYEYDPFYQTLTDTCFALAEGETSEWFESGDGWYLVRKLPKDESMLSSDAGMDALRASVRNDRFYKKVFDRASSVSATAESTDAYAALTFDGIRMP